MEYRSESDGWFLARPEISLEIGFKEYLLEASKVNFKYQEWLLSQAREVTIDDSAKVTPYQQEIIKYKQAVKANQCFMTSFLLPQFCTDIKYHEGLILAEVVHEQRNFKMTALHAWNSFNGIHFDLTSESGSMSGKVSPVYLPFLTLDCEAIKVIKPKLNGAFRDCGYIFYQEFIEK